MFNRIFLIGYLTKNVEIKYISNDLTLAKTSIATTNKVRNFHGELIDEICFIELIFWNTTADNAYKYLQKGSRILIDGRLKYNHWINNFGEKKSKHSIAVKKFTLLKRKNPIYYTTEFLSEKEIDSIPVIDVDLDDY